MQRLKQLFLHGALIRRMRQAPLCYLQAVDALRQGVDLGDQVQLRRVGQSVDHIGALTVGNVGLRPQESQILLCQSQGG